MTKAALAYVGAVALAFSTLVAGTAGAYATGPTGAIAPTVGGRTTNDAISADAIDGTGVCNISKWSDITGSLCRTGADGGAGGARLAGHAVVLSHSTAVTAHNTAVPAGTKVYLRWTDKDGKTSPIYVTQTHNGFKGARDGAYAFSIPRWVDSSLTPHYFLPGVTNQPKIKIWFEPYTDAVTGKQVVMMRDTLSGWGNPSLSDTSYGTQNKIGANYVDLQYINNVVLGGYQMPAEYMTADAQKESTSTWKLPDSSAKRNSVQGTVWIENTGSLGGSGPTFDPKKDTAAKNFRVVMSALAPQCQKQAAKIAKKPASDWTKLTKEMLNNPECIAETVYATTDAKGHYSIKFSSDKVFNHGETLYGYVEDPQGHVLPSYAAFADNVFNAVNQNLGMVEPHGIPYTPSFGNYYNDVHFAVVPYYGLGLTLDKHEVNNKTTPVTPTLSGYSFSPAGNTIIWTDKNGTQVKICEKITTSGAINDCAWTVPDGATSGDVFTATLYYGDNPVDADSFVYVEGDADGDGVPDDKDKCADTPAEAEVDEDGCTMAQRYQPNYTETDAKVGQAATSKPPTFDDVTTTGVVEKIPYNNLIQNKGTAEETTGSATFAVSMADTTVEKAGAVTTTPENEGRKEVPVKVTYPDNSVDDVSAPFIATDGDRDGDGVPDRKDKCPNTPKDYQGRVTEDGCAIPTVSDFTVRGTVDKAINPVQITIVDPDNIVTDCTSTDLPLGLTAKWEDNKCVVSTDTVPDSAFSQDGLKVEVAYQGGTTTSHGSVAITDKPDSDKDGVPDPEDPSNPKDGEDHCPDTPADAGVDDNGCSVAPTVGAAPNINGTVNEPITPVVVKVTNPGKANITCEPKDLPAGLTIAYDEAKGGCVISGTPTVKVPARTTYTVTVKYTPQDKNNPGGSIDKTGDVTIKGKDSDGDGVDDPIDPNKPKDGEDHCQGTPKGAQVDANGCSVAPTVGTVPDVKGETDKPITPVDVPVHNSGKIAKLECHAEGLAAGLTIKLNKEGTACVISGTPTEPKTGEVKVTVTYPDPQNPEKTKTSEPSTGKVNITKHDNGGGNTPGGNTPGGSTPGGNTPGGTTPGGTTPGGTTPSPELPPVAGVQEHPQPAPNANGGNKAPLPPVAGVTETPSLVPTTPYQPKIPSALARTGVYSVSVITALAVLLSGLGAWFSLRSRKLDQE